MIGSTHILRGECDVLSRSCRFAQKVVDAGEAKLHMATRDVLIRSFMAGAILALAAVFAVTIAVQTGVPLIGALLFPVGFCMLYLLGYDLLTGVFCAHSFGMAR